MASEQPDEAADDEVLEAIALGHKIGRVASDDVGVIGFLQELRWSRSELTALRAANAELVKERNDLRADIARVVEAKHGWSLLGLEKATRDLAAKYPNNTKEVQG